MSHEDDKTGILHVSNEYMKNLAAYCRDRQAHRSPVSLLENTAMTVGQEQLFLARRISIFEYRERLPRRDAGLAIEGREGSYVPTKVTKL